MKKLALSLSLLTILFLGLLSCDDLLNNLVINLPVTFEESFVINAVEASNLHIQTDIEVEADITKLIQEKNADLGTENIESAKIESCELFLTSTFDLDSGNDFTALDFVKVSMKSNHNEDWILIGEVDAPQEKDHIIIPVDKDMNLKDYFEADVFSFRIEGVSNRPITEQMESTIKTTFKLVVKSDDL